jgi:hypothetical protein
MRYILNNKRFSLIGAVMSVALSMSAWSVQAQSLDVSEAYVREVIPGQTNSAAFMLLTNNGDNDKVLVAIKSEAAQRIELHQHIHQHNAMRMESVDQVVIPAGEQFAFSPGGYHVMLIGVTSALRAGENINLSLQFLDGSVQQVALPVQSIMDR